MSVPDTSAQTSLAGALARYLADPDTGDTDATTTRRAIRRFTRIAGRRPEDIPLDLATIRTLLATHAPAIRALPKNGRAAARKALKQLLEHAGRIPALSVLDHPVASDWQALIDSIEDRFLRVRLLPLARHASSLGRAPAAICAGDFRELRARIERETINMDATNIANRARRAWNSLARERPDWPAPAVAAPRNTLQFALPIGDFPVSFQAQFDQLFARMECPDPLADRPGRRLSPATIRERRAQLLRAASTLVHNGVPIDRITGLDILFTEDSFKTILLRFHDPKTGWMPCAATSASTLIGIARHAFGNDDPRIAALKAIARRIERPAPGLSRRAREGLRAYDPRAQQRLLALPDRLAAEAQVLAKTSPRRGASLMEAAVALAILLDAPIRLRNLVGLDLEQDFTRRNGRITGLQIDGTRVKNGMTIDAPLSPRTITLLDRFLRTHRPRLANAGSTLLFSPRKGNGVRAANAFATKLQKMVERHLGVRFHAHLVRHLAVTMLLEADPANMPVAQRVLGHVATKTTERQYGAVRTRGAFRIYHEELERQAERQGRATPGNRRPRLAS